MSATPFQSIVEDVTKEEPLAVRVKLLPPAVVDVGDIEERTGTGLLMVNVCALDVPPPGVGLTTVIEAVPAVVISEDGTVAVT